jgi:metal-dependent hydrolase (beta-lactamase superfamily II)
MISRFALALAAVPGALALGEARFALGKWAADRAFREARVQKLRDVGATRSLSILPLVDWFPASPDLRGEPGVSYLVQTDENRILLDVGLNLERSDPSPLLHNMQKLGVSLDDIDTLVISHRHIDHVGGLPWLVRRTFSLGNEQLDLRAKRVFVPEVMTYPAVDTVCCREPTVIAQGVATTGAIRAQIYMGRIDEQALVIRLEGKGLVVVVGCGHQSLPRILTRARELFDEPIYAVIGGLHYPVPRGRWLRMGVDMQRLVVYGPFGAPSRSEVVRQIGLLAEHRPEWVSLSAHDSSDEMIGEFRRAFGPRYHDLRVGEPLSIAKPEPALEALSA